MGGLLQVEPSGRRASLPALVLVLGLVATYALAGVRSAQLQRERQILFDAEAAAVQQAIVASAERRVGDFRSGVNFLATTHPGPVDQFEAFFLRELEGLDADDPGVLFFEEVSAGDIGTLVEREHRLGNTDFAITPFRNPADTKLVLTRTTRDLSVFGHRLRGLDATVLRDEVLPSGFGDEGFELHIARSRQLRAFSGPDDLSAILIAGVVDSDGRFLGYAVHFDSLSSYLSAVDGESLENLNVELRASGIDEPIVQHLTDDPKPLAEAELHHRRDVETASLRWSIDVWADDAFGPDPNPFAQRGLWFVGLGVTALATVFAGWRDHAKRRLDHARSELARARSLAVTDGLTGLLNRIGLIDAARELAPTEPAALFFVDLDGFKSVNDEEGHEHGDRVLRQVAEQLRSIFRAEDLVGRIGGDEFVVFTVDVAEPSQVEAVSRRITATISGLDPRITASLGVAIRGPGESTDVKEMLRTADEAMYEAKRAGGDRHTVRS